MKSKLIAAISSILAICFLLITSLNASEPSNFEKVRIEGEIKEITDHPNFYILLDTHRVETKRILMTEGVTVYKNISLPAYLSIFRDQPTKFTEEDRMLNLKKGDSVIVYVRIDKSQKERDRLSGSAGVLVENSLGGYGVTSYTDKAFAWIENAKFESWDKDFWNKKLAEKRDQEKAKAIAEEKALKERAETDRQVAQENLRREEEERRLRAEAEFQAAQTKMRIEEEKEKIREQRIADLKSGKLKITNIEDAKLAFNPSIDDKYTSGIPIDGLKATGQYYLWSGTLSWKAGKTYFCLDSFMGNTKCFGFMNVIVRFNEMLENSPVTVVGKLAGTSEVTLVNKSSGFKENKTVAVLTDCYVF